MIDKDLEASSGTYLCGDTLTAADILLSFPLIAVKDKLNDFGTWDAPDGKWETAHPHLSKYIDTLVKEDGYVKSEEKIKALVPGDYKYYPM